MKAATLTQSDLIVMYEQLRSDSELCEHPELSVHYDYALRGLRRIIESHGPTALYREWLGQFRPVVVDQRTFVVDL